MLPSVERPAQDDTVPGTRLRAVLVAEARRFESVAALGACTVVAVLVTWRLLHPNVFSDDAFVHQYWMWHWKDPQLFNDEPHRRAARVGALSRRIPGAVLAREPRRRPDRVRRVGRRGADGACRAG